MAKLRVGLLFGGRSVEHEVSVASATSILAALDPSLYDVRLIGVDRDGRWQIGAQAIAPGASLGDSEVLLPANPRGGELVDAAPGGGQVALQLDVVFPIIHGAGGEDGTLQGLLELAGVPYVGSGVLGSSIQMDKDIAKRLLAQAGLPVVPWRVLRGAALEGIDCAQRALAAVEELGGFPVFVKPANSGSSVGTSRAEDADALSASVEEAARYDRKVLIERAIVGREVEVAILGNDDPKASVPGEIRNDKSFYDYEAKYADDETELLIPARLDEQQSERLREMAVEAFRLLEGSGFARVDFFIEDATGAVYVNEVNSLPGFTEGSMFPLMWQASGLEYPELISRLIDLALERHGRRREIETTYRRG